MVMCLFANVPPATQVGLINAVCGLDWTIDDMMLAGERAWNLKRAINNRLGLTAENDRLPKALLEPLAGGGSGGFAPDVQGMLYAYYEARGWDQTTGFPTKRKLQCLQLNEPAIDLWG
jgi:aldehyde:ferredoxin oxidoreductase